ncbi:MAG: transglutaminase domain-containing protein [Candidatus Shapirobacteria bacterium]|jgi:hypothetical protein
MFFLLLFLLFTKPVLATNDFDIKENITYSIDLSGQASVTHQINITNNFSQIYPQNYQLNIQGLSLTDLSVSDDNGNILQSFTTNNDATTIKLKFNQAKIGKNQITSFKLNYKIPSFAKNKGKTWEISLPQSIGDNLSSTQIKIQAPPDFGSLSFASIPVKFENFGTQNQISFSSDNFQNKILIILGNYQLFNFTLNYQLNNPSNDQTFTEIALIPDTYSQSVFYQSISPSPLSIRVDSDGNWLAKYQLKAQENINITAEGQVKTGITSPQSTPDLSLYLKEQPFWPISDPQIQTISQNLSSPRSIYDYVVNTLNYNYDRINSNSTRLGALEALNQPNNALCTEFTDLFVTLARAKGIAAREIEGYAYSNNSKIKPINLQSDVLHAWPEYFDISTNLWKAIDPTWAKTTNGIDYFNDLDLNHVTFVTHGLDSQLPQVPNAHLEFASEEIKSEHNLPQLSLQGSQLILKNNSPNSQKNLHLSIPTLSYEKDVNTILPYSSVTFSIPTVNFFASLLPKYQKITVVLTNSDSLTNTQNLQNSTHFLNLGISIIVSLVILSISGIIITSHHHEKNS